MKTFTFKKLVKWCFAVFGDIIIGWGIYVHFEMPVNVETLSKVAQHHEDVSIYVDFGIDSSKRRFFVYDNWEGKLLASSKCTHGSGEESTSSIPVFSNEPGSYCSCLGEYKLTGNSRLYNVDMPCIRLVGLSPTNSNTAGRGITIHKAPLVADNISLGLPIPVSPMISEGCFGISTKTFKLLQSLVDQQKTIYLYAVCH